MKISTKGRYALRVMVDLAMNTRKDYVKVKDIAIRQEISDKYLEQIISTLNKAGYVKSARGANGGYRLTKDPKEYTVEMILRLTEGSLAPVACVEDGMSECERADTCATLYVWDGLYKVVKDYLSSITLEDIANRQEAMLFGRDI